MSAGIKIELPIEDDEYIDAVIYPDLSVTFQDYDIEHDIVLADLGEEPSDAVLFLQKYEQYGILMLSIDEDLYESFSDSIAGIKKLSKKDRSLWADQICKNLETMLRVRLYDDDEIRAIHHIIDVVSESISIDGAAHFTDFVADYVSYINGTLIVQINKIPCLEVTISFTAGYEGSLPDTPEFSISDYEYDDDLGNNIKNLYGPIYGTGYKSSREFNADEPYKNDERFEKYNPLEGFSSGKWALAINEKWGDIIFTALYKTSEQLDASLQYILQWFGVFRFLSYDIRRFIARPYKDKDAIFLYELDEPGDPPEVVAAEGWEEV